MTLPAVEIEPPKPGTPIFTAGNWNKFGKLSRIVPIRFFHTTSWVFKSTPATYPQAGCLQGKPSGDKNALISTP
ncbi:hypothetical protein D9M71_809170 [compost metagenome]